MEQVRRVHNAVHKLVEVGSTCCYQRALRQVPCDPETSISLGFSHAREFEREPGLSVLRALGHESRERLQRLHHVIHAVQNSVNVLEGPQAPTADHGDGGEFARGSAGRQGPL